MRPTISSTKFVHMDSSLLVSRNENDLEEGANANDEVEEDNDAGDEKDDEEGDAEKLAKLQVVEDEATEELDTVLSNE